LAAAAALAVPARPSQLAEAVLARQAVTFQARLADCALSLAAITLAPAQAMLLARVALSRTTAHAGQDPGCGDVAMIDDGSAWLSAQPRAPPE